MLILGIETSCDETSASLVENGTKLLSLVTATSTDMHKKYGGIIPDRAAREQLKSILAVVKESLLPIHSSQVPEIDAIAVTYGPGLIGSLLIGVETAKSLALAWNKPLIPVNHLIGHIYANWIDTTEIPQFPALVLIVSGGHSELVLMKNHGKFQLLGSTLDDAAGECFDKCGRVLDLPYPYGPHIQELAAKYKQAKNEKPLLPRPMVGKPSFDFSFSGLKTAFVNLVREQKIGKEQMAFELQEAITDVLVKKTIKAAEKFQPKSILVAGGVAANARLREKLEDYKNELNAQVFIPQIKFCTDNAAVIASAAFFNNKPTQIEKVEADPSLNILSA